MHAVCIQQDSPSLLDNADAVIERWQFEVELARALTAPHLGSMLRGCFGHALKQLACTCPSEQHAPTCRYAAIFEPSAPEAMAKRFQSTPPAYVITPPAPTAQARRHFSFQVTLLGPALAERTLVYQAWQLAATQGLAGIAARLRPAPPQTFPSRFAASTQLKLVFTSPLFIKRASQACFSPTVADVIEALVRRLHLSQQLYGVPQLPPPTKSAWLEQLDLAQCQSHWQPVRYQRHSNRQQQAMPLAGVLGELCLAGQMDAQFVQACYLGQWLHIGGKVALGQGAYQLHISSPIEQGVNAQ